MQSSSEFICTSLDASANGKNHVSPEDFGIVVKVFVSVGISYLWVFAFVFSNFIEFSAKFTNCLYKLMLTSLLSNLYS